MFSRCIVNGAVDELRVAVDANADECRKFLIVDTVIGSLLFLCVVNGAVDELHAVVDADVGVSRNLKVKLEFLVSLLHLRYALARAVVGELSPTSNRAVVVARVATA